METNLKTDLEDVLDIDKKYIFSILKKAKKISFDRVCIVVCPVCSTIICILEHPKHKYVCILCRKEYKNIEVLKIIILNLSKFEEFINYFFNGEGAITSSIKLNIYIPTVRRWIKAILILLKTN